MTDITELAPAMKAAAEKATPGPWGVARDGKTLVSNQSHPIATVSDAMHRMLTDGSTGKDAEFIALANPSNVIALVEALEKTQTEVKRQENIASALFDEVSQLRRNADDKAHELKKIITEMEEENNRQVLEVMRLSSLVAELESRTVTVKLPEPPGPMSIGARTVYFGIVADVVRSFQDGLSAAGIKVEAE